MEKSMSEEKLLRELDERLNRLSVEGLWSQASEADLATYSADPQTTVLPHVWKWQDTFTMRSGRWATCTASTARPRGACFVSSILRIRDIRTEDNARQRTPCL